MSANGRVIRIHRRTFARRDQALTLVGVQCVDCHRVVPLARAEQLPVTWEWACRDQHDCWRHALGLRQPKEGRR